jgi:hypothetical protein
MSLDLLTIEPAIDFCRNVKCLLQYLIIFDLLPYFFIQILLPFFIVLIDHSYSTINRGGKRMRTDI